MRQIPFFVCDSFTETPFSGNPAGVFFDDSGSLTDDEMRRLAGEVHLESAFVSPTADAEVDLRLRYFTGLTEVPLCGHATVAAFTALVAAGRFDSGQDLRAITNVGLLPISLGEKGTVTLFQNPPEFSLPFSEDVVLRVAAALGLNAESDILPTNLPVRRISTGTTWLFVPVASVANVDTTPTDFAAIASLSSSLDVYGAYVFTPDRNKEPLNIWSRCYAPIAGLNEDPVTGSASGALGGYLAECGLLDVKPDSSATFTTQQGFAGGRGGSACVTVSRDTDGSYERIAVTGTALILAQGTFTLP